MRAAVTFVFVHLANCAFAWQHLNLRHINGDLTRVKNLNRLAAALPESTEDEGKKVAMSALYRGPSNLGMVTCQYTTGVGLTHLYTATKHKILERFPDVKVDRKKVDPRVDPDCFKISVDDRVVYSKKVGSGVVYLRMNQLEAAIQSARRRRRSHQVILSRILECFNIKPV